jgi:hypothetical protein
MGENMVNLAGLQSLWLRVRKKFSLLPMLLIMIIFGGLLMLTKGSAVAPFVYTVL